MNKLYVLLCCLFGILSASFSQEKTARSAIVLFMDGEGVVVRDTEEIKLKTSLSLIENDKVVLNKGNAVVMLLSGEEISLTAPSDYTIPSASSPHKSHISVMLKESDKGKSLLSQSGFAYQLRGESTVFPAISKIADNSNTVLHIGYDNILELDLGLKVVDSQTQQVVYEIESVTDSMISLEKVPFENERTYHWVLSNTPNGKPEMGILVMPKEADANNMKIIKKPQTHFEYLDAISFYYNDKYYFEVLRLIDMAIEEYPDYKIYQLMRSNLGAE